MGGIIAFFAYLRENGGQVLELLGQHASLSLIGVGFGIVSALPLGILVSRKPRIGSWVIDVSDMLYTIPSLALLGILAKYLGFGWLPVIVALTVYSWLPILKNTVAGLAGVDSSAKEAARGMGATEMQILMRVELPLAMPIIMSGIRTVSVLTVGITTMAALVGAGGLGVLIFQGITMMDNKVTLAGTIPVAIIAIALDQSFGLLERNLRNHRGMSTLEGE
jgi:osmoprotectant transport system permease protein